MQTEINAIDEAMSVVRVVCLTVLFLMLAAVIASPQSKPDPQLPPDLTHVSNQSCIVVEHSVGETFDAKTKEIETKYYYRVEPYAEYSDHRDRWELPKETVFASREIHPGAIGDFPSSHEAIDACLAWTKKVRAAITKENEKMAHGGPNNSVDKK